MDRHILDRSHFDNPNILLRDLKEILIEILFCFSLQFLNAQKIFIARRQTNKCFTFFHCKYQEYSGCNKEVSFIDHCKALVTIVNIKNKSLSK